MGQLWGDFDPTMLLAVFDLTPQMLSFAVCLEFVVKRWQVKPSHFSQCVETCARLSNEFTGYTLKCAIWTELQENRWLRFRKPGRKLKSCRAGCGHDEWATATCLQSAQVGRPPTPHHPHLPPSNHKKMFPQVPLVMSSNAGNEFPPQQHNLFGSRLLPALN